MFGRRSGEDVRPTLDQWAMQLARATATRATCLRRAVGCVLLDAKGRVISTGYNGVAAGQPHCNDEASAKVVVMGEHHVVTNHPNACPGSALPSGTGLDACQAIHAEQNALLQCRDVDRVHACYSTASPCVTCTKLLLNTGCEHVFFDEEYPQPEARELWLKSGRGRTWTKV